jgi:hypothetical protein
MDLAEDIKNYFDAHGIDGLDKYIADNPDKSDGVRAMAIYLWATWKYKQAGLSSVVGTDENDVIQWIEPYFISMDADLVGVTEQVEEFSTREKSTSDEIMMTLVAECFEVYDTPTNGQLLWTLFTNGFTDIVYNYALIVHLQDKGYIQVVNNVSPE